jgi:hypothetical protein
MPDAQSNTLTFSDDFTLVALKKIAAAVVGLVLLWEVFALLALNKKSSVILSITNSTDPWGMGPVMVAALFFVPLGILGVLMALFMEHRTINIDTKAGGVEELNWRGWSTPRRIRRFTDFEGVHTLDYDGKRVIALKPRLGTHVMIPGTAKLDDAERDATTKSIASAMNRPHLGHQGATSGED